MGGQMEHRMDQGYQLSQVFDAEKVRELITGDFDGIPIKWVTIKEPLQLIIANGVDMLHATVVADYMKRNGISGDALEWGRQNLLDAGSVLFDVTQKNEQGKPTMVLDCNVMSIGSSAYTSMGTGNRSQTMGEFRNVLMQVREQGVDGAGFDFALTDGSAGLKRSDIDWGPTADRN